MKNVFMLLVAALVLVSCGSEATTEDSQQTNSPAATDAAAPAGVVYHYTCAQHPEGGSNAQGNCSICGAQLAHNQAWHNQPGNQPTQTQTQTQDGSSPVIQTQPPTQTPEPAQNAAGVWHYVCSNGCAGGGGAATACPTCGATLVHNSAYHQ